MLSNSKRAFEIGWSNGQKNEHIALFRVPPGVRKHYMAGYALGIKSREAMKLPIKPVKQYHHYVVLSTKGNVEYAELEKR